jgi:hypothetical protein
MIGDDNKNAADQPVTPRSAHVGYRDNDCPFTLSSPAMPPDSPPLTPRLLPPCNGSPASVTRIVPRDLPDRSTRAGAGRHASSSALKASVAGITNDSSVFSWVNRMESAPAVEFVAGQHRRGKIRVRLMQYCGLYRHVLRLLRLLGHAALRTKREPALSSTL